MATRKSPPERRRSARRPILEAFDLFVVLPFKGDHRLKIHDVSDHGVGFDLDMEGEPIDATRLEVGKDLTVQLHFNRRLSLPLKLRVTRIEARGGVRRVGGELVAKKSEETKAFKAFVSLVDALTATGRYKA